MAIVEETAGGDAPSIDDGLYVVIVKDVTEQIMENDQFGHPEKLRFKFLVDGITDEAGEPVYLDPLVNKKLSKPDSKMQSTLSKWVAVFGVSVVGGRLDTNDFVGKRAQALIETDFEKSEWPRVKQLLPLKKGAKPTATKPQAVPPHEHDPAYTPEGDFICATCKEPLDPRTGNGKAPDFTAFWTRIRAAGKDRPEVIEVIGDLTALATMSQAELDTLAKQVIGK